MKQIKSSQSIDCGKKTETFIFLINYGKFLIQFLVTSGRTSPEIQQVALTLENSIGCKDEASELRKFLRSHNLVVEPANLVSPLKPHAVILLLNYS